MRSVPGAGTVCLLAALLAAVGAAGYWRRAQSAEAAGAGSAVDRLARRVALLEQRLDEMTRSRPRAGRVPPPAPATPPPAPVPAPPAPLAPPSAAAPGGATDPDAVRPAQGEDLGRLSDRLRALERREDDALVDPNAAAEDLATRAALAIEDGRSERARLYLQRLLERFPLHPSAPFALFTLAGQDMIAGDLAAARDRFARIARDFPADEHVPFAELHLGVIALQKGELAEARRVLEHAVDGLARDPVYHASALLNLAVTRRASGQPEEARALFQRVVDEHGDDPQCAAFAQRARGLMGGNGELR